ncbi:MAG TPA: nucleoside monophosphate kinase, partial [Candidatus Sulfotelmatobacter sp.]|nr:nucleoside monophosphate kinase [Candidatus Sulfotelmatobacter sp.]
GRKLSKYLQKPYVGTGDIIRDRAKNDPGPLGEACRKMIEEHAYLDPKLIGQILSDRLSRDDAKDGVVIDGALRTLDETEDFDKILDDAGKGNFEVDVVFLDVPDEIGIERRLNSPELRPGENRESVLKRLEHFYTNFDERMNIVRERYNFYKIDATKEIEKVFKNIISVINI